MSENKKSFVQGAILLMVAGLIVKIIGAFYRIPLTNIISTTGMGYYNVAYPVYSTLIVASTAGLPVAVSKMVSERVAIGNYAAAHNVFRVARTILLIMGAGMTVIMIALAGPISTGVMQENSYWSILAISPALFFVSILCAYRGYFQGMQMMGPTALTQVTEQLIKLAVGLGLAFWVLQETGNIAYASAAALVGVSVSEACALFVILYIYGRNKKKIINRCDPVILQKKNMHFKNNTAKLLKIAIPVTLGACIMPIVVAIDSGVVNVNLQYIGYTAEEASSAYGTLSGVVNTLVNMPAVLSTALAMSLVPAISEACARANTDLSKSRVSFGVKLAILVGLPAGVGFFLLGEPIIRMLYGGLNEEEIQLAAGLMRILCLSIIFLTFVQTSNALLQGMGHAVKPVISLAVGAGVKVVLSIVLIRIPSVGIYGAVYGTMACYIIATVMNAIFVARQSHFRFSMLNHIIKPVIATAVMGLLCYLVYEAVGPVSNTLGVLAAILVGVLVYFIVLFVLRTLTDEEVRLMPGGGRLRRIADRLGRRNRK